MKTLVLVGCCAALLSACSVNHDNTYHWRPYFDLEGKLQHIAFSNIIVLKDGKESIPDVKEQQGVAIRKTRFGELTSHETLGKIYGLFDANNVPMAVIFISDFLVPNNSLNPHIPEHIKALAKAKQFDFYEFGKQRLGIVRYRAKNGICQDFKEKAGVQLEMATNYYPQNSFTDFYTSFIRVQLNHKKALSAVDYEQKLTGQDKKLQAEMKDYVEKHWQKIADANINEKVGLLANIVCK
ncbi:MULTISPECIES: hypothetical protein [Pasteurellaceae]|uniref:hypothetical protein n=1 Tax=Pasteurellaceae TaxID=712 RepID=UPI003564D509